ncbi:MAG: hypothetical protein M1832_000068 [Thelocarpon impressellum]|nr:MAG: hypothetical protein M1832_000068 [Thelocarpon impressellum]
MAPTTSQYGRGIGGSGNPARGQDHGKQAPHPTSSSGAVDCPACVAQEGQNLFPQVICPGDGQRRIQGLDAAVGDHDAESHSLDACLDHVPPVTARALQELEIPRIISNPRLRHDVNFDPNLHFKPNTDGERGRRKRQQSDAYWAALSEEFLACVDAPRDPRWELDSRPPKLPRVFGEIRSILRTLIPERDVPIVMEMLDVTLLMQQIRRGTLDYLRLSTCLAHVLKSHCAPMRDNWVDDMVDRFRGGVRTGQVRHLVEGVRMLFGVLEAMKLDVANHQVRTIRPLLIDDTVTFEQHYFLRRIANGTLDPQPAIAWYSAYERYWGHRHEVVGLSDRDRPLAIFLRGVVDFLGSSTVDLPATFVFDCERMTSLKADVLGLVALEVCVKKLENTLEEQGHRAALPDEEIQGLKIAALSLVGECGDRDVCRSHWLDSVDKLALEIARRAQRLTGTCFGQKALARLEGELQTDLLPRSGLWQYVEGRALESVWTQTCKQSVDYLKLPMLAVAETACPSSLHERPAENVSSLFSSVVTSLARIASLHWRVFGSIVYLRPQDFECEINRQDVGLIGPMRGMRLEG